MKELELEAQIKDLDRQLRASRRRSEGATLARMLVEAEFQRGLRAVREAKMSELRAERAAAMARLTREGE